MPETSELIFNAIKEISKLFPFPGYMAEDNGTQGPYSSIAKTLMQYLPAGRKILDFGSGACDKTAVLQRIGYDCAACDDLQDDWHKLPGNQNKIKEFAQSQGIDFKLMTEPVIPFTDNCFDMIMLHDVLEHLHDSPRELLNSLLEISKSESFLFITVPNAVNIRKRLDVLRGKTNLPGFAGYYWYPGHWRGHIREYVREDLIKPDQLSRPRTS